MLFDSAPSRHLWAIAFICGFMSYLRGGEVARCAVSASVCARASLGSGVRELRAIRNRRLRHHIAPPWMES